MYELNSMSPFMSERVGDFDKMVPYYTPYSSSMFTYMPTKSNFLSNNQLGAYSYDPNEPRYSKLYKSYFKFFNYDLDRMAHLSQNHLPYVDLNNLAKMKILHPKSFDYDESFDRLPDSHTLKSPHYSFLPYKTGGSKDQRRLTQLNSRNLKDEENTYYNNLFRAETAAALHKEIEKNFSNKHISLKEKKKLLKKLEKNFNSKGKIIKFLDKEFPDNQHYLPKKLHLGKNHNYKENDKSSEVDRKLESMLNHKKRKHKKKRRNSNSRTLFGIPINMNIF